MTKTRQDGSSKGRLDVTFRATDRAIVFQAGNPSGSFRRQGQRVDSAPTSSLNHVANNAALGLGLGWRVCSQTPLSLA